MTGAAVTENRVFATLVPAAVVTATLLVFVPTVAARSTVMLAVSWLVLTKVVELTTTLAPKVDERPPVDV